MSLRVLCLIQEGAEAAWRPKHVASPVRFELPWKNTIACGGIAWPGKSYIIEWQVDRSKTSSSPCELLERLGPGVPVKRDGTLRRSATVVALNLV